jgi:hypothetical protein
MTPLANVYKVIRQIKSLSIVDLDLLIQQTQEQKGKFDNKEIIKITDHNLKVLKSLKRTKEVIHEKDQPKNI